MHSFRTSLLKITTILLIFYSCSSKHGAEKPEPTKPSQIQVVNILRYEQDLLSNKIIPLKQKLAELAPQYSFFLGSNWQDTLNMLRLTQYINDSLVQNLYRQENKKFQDIKFLKAGLEDAFARIRTDFPGFRQPKVFTFISGLDMESPVIYADSMLAVGLDVFLGSDVTLYKKAGIPEYKIQKMTPSNLLPACIHSIASRFLANDIDKQTLLDKMIEAGKILYFEDRMLPSVTENSKIGYTDNQLKWCINNEGNIWAFIIENQLLYSNNPVSVSKLMNDAPFTTGLVHESPGGLGQWVGWQIVRTYMWNHPGVKLGELMQNTDSQAILTESQYHPQK